MQLHFVLVQDSSTKRLVRLGRFKWVMVVHQLWWIYILECEGGFLYTGITTDLQRRFDMHCQGRGARYTRMHRPLRFLGVKSVDGRAEASREEFRLKQLSRTEKWLWIKAHACGDGFCYSADS